ncbi:MAG TPA: hypothetical protein VMH05_24885 [Bryobacteraceae bacterium]|nr:hypothetical protein [Bryobacteraceae bacterium]
MSAVTFGIALNFLFFAALGAGPCLWLLSGPRRLALAIAIAPVAGFALTTVFGTYLTLLDLPVSRWCLPWIVVTLSGSAALTASYLLREKIFRRGGKRWPVLAACAFLLLSALTVAPWSLGGLKYTILRGNGADSFNYITAAGYLEREPFHWARRVDTQTLVDRQLSYQRASNLLNVRWATPMMLAFTSQVAGAPAYRFEYLFSVLCFLLAYGPVLAYTRIFLQLRPRHALLAAFAICAGFWAQLIVDIRADGQQNSVPVLLLIALLLVHVESRRPAGIYWREHLLLAIAALALLFLYPEIVPMAALGCVLFLAVQLWRAPARGTRLAGYLITLGIIILGAIPMAGFLAGFLQSQMSSAMSHPNQWHITYFHWLYTDPFTGLWGFGPLVVPVLPHVILLVPGIVLTAALVVAVARTLSRPSHTSPGMRLAASLTFAACLEWAYLVLRKQYWAGAKGLSFGYVFVILTLLGALFASPRLHKKTWGGFTGNFVGVCAMVWLLLQCGLALDRPWLAASGGDYANYIQGHGEYRRHDWNIAALDAVLQGQKGITVWSDLSNPWLSEYLELALGAEVHLVNIGASRDFQDFPIPRQSITQRPQYLIVENSQLGALSSPPVARTSEISLLPCPAGRSAIILSVHAPNGIEGSPKGPFFWMGGGPAAIEFLSFENSAVTFQGRFSLGPSRPGLSYRSLSIASAGPPQHIKVEEGIQEFRVPAVRGLNRVSLEVEEQPTFFIPTDTRPLMLRIDDLKIENADRAAASLRGGKLKRRLTAPLPVVLQALSIIL